MLNPVSSQLLQPLTPARVGLGAVGEVGDAFGGTTLDLSGACPAHSGAQACVTPLNRTGFLCHNRRSCIPASRVCDGVPTCAHGEDEEEALCREYQLQGARSTNFLRSAPHSNSPCSHAEARPPLNIPGTLMSPGLCLYVVALSQEHLPPPCHTHHICAQARLCLHSGHLHAQRTCVQSSWQSSSVTSSRKPSLTPKLDQVPSLRLSQPLCCPVS